MLLSLPLSLILLPPALSVAEPLHIGLSRRAGPINHDKDYYNSIAENIRQKYGFKASKKRASADIPLLNIQIDAIYAASVDFGTPAQTFSVVVDTGSSDLWVASTACVGCDTSIPLFDPSKSSSFNASEFGTTISYGQGNVTGQIVTDVVTMGGFSVPSQTFLAAKQIAEGVIVDEFSGLMGLAFPPLSATRSTPFWQALANGGLLTSPEMSFQFTRERGNPLASEVEPGGTFTLGGTNPSLFTGDIEFLDLPSGTPTFWFLNMAAVTVQGKSVAITTGSAALAAIDTGTTLIGGPTADVQAIWDAVGGQPISQMPGYFQFPCSTHLQVSISFGGKLWPIDPRDMNLGPVVGQDVQCLGAIFDLSMGTNIVSGGGNPSWVVGATFLKNVYSVFRSEPPSIGFAKLSAAAGGSGTAGFAATRSTTSAGDTILSSNGVLSSGVVKLTLIASLVASLLAACLL